MKSFKKVLILLLTMTLFGAVSGCKTPDEGSSSKAVVLPTVYARPQRVADVESWAGEVVKDGKNNEEPTDNGVIKSTFYELKVNGTTVPVYTTRCHESPHSFAWVDVEGAPETIELTVELFTRKEYTSAVVLPEKHGAAAVVSGKKVMATIRKYGDYSFAFGLKNKSPSPHNEPFTLYVAPEEPLEIPEGWTEKVFEPGDHPYENTRFTDENTVYRFKAGTHEINSIKMPNNSILYLDRGAYLLANDPGDTRSVLEIVDVKNVKILGRGLIDFSSVDGGDDKRKHPSTVARSEDIVYSGLTFINSNTWTLCFYASKNVTVSRNMLFAFRVYSDGIMMSECRDSTGSYNFVRTGDDAIEVKGTGWWQDGATANKQQAQNILYEHNSVWTDKGTAYGAIWENAVGFSGVTFRNNSVGFAMPMWKPGNYDNVIDVYAGDHASPGIWKDITFENFEIYEAWNNAMTVRAEGQGAHFENVLFKNINVKRSPNGYRAIRIKLDVKGMTDYSATVKNIVFDSITFKGEKLGADSIDDSTVIDFYTDNEQNRALIEIR